MIEYKFYNLIYVIIIVFPVFMPLIEKLTWNIFKDLNDHR